MSHKKENKPEGKLVPSEWQKLSLERKQPLHISWQKI